MDRERWMDGWMDEKWMEGTLVQYFRVCRGRFVSVVHTRHDIDSMDQHASSPLVCLSVCMSVAIASSKLSLTPRTRHAHHDCLPASQSVSLCVRRSLEHRQCAARPFPDTHRHTHTETSIHPSIHLCVLWCGYESPSALCLMAGLLIDWRPFLLSFSLCDDLSSSTAARPRLRDTCCCCELLCVCRRTLQPLPM